MRVRGMYSMAIVCLGLSVLVGCQSLLVLLPAAAARMNEADLPASNAVSIPC